MDNKKWYKRVSTLFWFLLATMFFWFPVLLTLFSYFLHLENSIELNELSLNGIYLYGVNTYNNVVGTLFGGDLLESLPLPFLVDAFNALFTQLQFDMSLFMVDYLCVALAWFVSVYFYELIVDCLVWVPRFCHKLIEKGVDY